MLFFLFSSHQAKCPLKGFEGWFLGHSDWHELLKMVPQLPDPSCLPAQNSRSPSLPTDHMESSPSSALWMPSVSLMWMKVPAILTTLKPPCPPQVCLQGELVERRHSHYIGLWITGELRAIRLLSLNPQSTHDTWGSPVSSCGQGAMAGELTFGFLGSLWAPWQHQGRFRALPVPGSVSAQAGGCGRDRVLQRPTGVPRMSSSTSLLRETVSFLFPCSAMLPYSTWGN